MGEKTQIRYPYLDYARVFVAYLVIFGHLLPTMDMTVRPYIYAFHMPFFFLVSGILHKYDGTIQIKKYARTLLIPFLFFNAVFFVLKPICYWFGIWGSPFNSYTEFFPMCWAFAKSSVSEVFLGMNGIDGPTWFIVALFWCKIFMDALKKHKWLSAVYLVLFCVLFVIKSPMKGQNVLFVRQACMAFPFYYIGCVGKNVFHQLPSRSKWQKIAVFIVSIAVSILVTCFNGRVSVFASSFGSLPYKICIPVFYLNALIASFGFLALSSCFSENKLIKKVALSLITILGAQNLFIYTLHSYVQNMFLLCAVLSIPILICCVLIHQLLEKHWPVLVGKVKPKKQS